MNVLWRGFDSIIIIFATLFASGCASDPKISVRGGEDVTLPALSTRTVDSSLDSISSQNSSLESQSQRDVEMILKARAAANQRVVEQASKPAPTTPSLEPHAARPSIVWNPPPATTKTTPKDGKADVHQPPLGHRSPGSTAAADKAPSDKTSPAQAMLVAPTTQPSLEPDRLKKLMVDLSRELYSTGSYSNAPLRELMVIASMSMIDPQRGLDPQAVPDLTEKERELLGKLQTFFASLGKSIDGQADSEQAIIEAVSKLRESLVKEPVLRLPTVSLCTRVGGFGDFSPFDRFTFLAAAEQKVIVYIEIGDFTSVLNQKNEYVTELSQQLIIYSDRDGIPVWKEDWQSAVDVSKNKRQDFFTVQVVTLPKALSVGKYQLKVRVRDQKSQAEAESSITFEMVADPKMATGLGGK